MRRFMDSYFKGVVIFAQKVYMLLSTVPFIFKGTDENKNFRMIITQNRFYFQKIEDEALKDNYMYFDWESGNTCIPGVCIAHSSNPTPVKGGLYFNDQNNKWYKCEDGENWVQANI